MSAKRSPTKSHTPTGAPSFDKREALLAFSRQPRRSPQDFWGSLTIEQAESALYGVCRAPPLLVIHGQTKGSISANENKPKETKGNQRKPKETKGNQRKPKETNQRSPSGYTHFMAFSLYVVAHNAPSHSFLSSKVLLGVAPASACWLRNLPGWTCPPQPSPQGAPCQHAALLWACGVPGALFGPLKESQRETGAPPSFFLTLPYPGIPVLDKPGQVLVNRFPPALSTLSLSSKGPSVQSIAPKFDRKDRILCAPSRYSNSGLENGLPSSRSYPST